MFSKNKIKFLRSLSQKKVRSESGLFLVEGEKNVLETLSSVFEIVELFGTEGFIQKYQAEITAKLNAFEVVSQNDLEKSGTLESNDSCLAVVKMKDEILLIPEKEEFVLVLDQIQDPGNLGTILRIADWYAIRKLIFSEDTVDLYNPKVISASKGSFLRVQSYYCPLNEYLNTYSSKNIYGAMLQGENLHQFQFGENGFIVFGNESRGISKDIAQLVNFPVAIPCFGGAESLNVGVAAAVFCDNLRRQVIIKV